jgi:hypothetical protein
MLKSAKWFLLVLLLVAGATAIYVEFFVEERLRQRTEARINAALEGYTVKIQRLDFHPIGFSLDLENTVITQDAHPDRPVAEIPLLTASVHWRALLSGRLVADFYIRDPKLFIDLKRMRSEARDDVSFEERGWQEALQAIYPLKINEFELINGDLTYVDEGPYRPLQLRRVNFRAGNIRNVKSEPGQYPSEVHLDGDVFDKGKVTVDGHADFLAVPHASIKAAVDLRQVELDYFRPIIERSQLSVRGGVLNTAGNIEYANNRKIFEIPKIEIVKFVGDYTHVKAATSPTKEIAEKTDKVIREQSNKQDLDVRVNEISVVDSEIGIINQASNPVYRLFLTNARLNVKNLSNQSGTGTAVGTLTGRFMGSGPARATISFKPQGKSANFDLQIAIDQADIKPLNKLFLAYGGFDVAAGAFSFYSEIAVRDGAVDGYVKPLFKNISIYDSKQDGDKPILRQLYEGILGGLSWILQNRPREEVATTTKISGRLSNPQTSTLDIILGLIQNAFFHSILPGLETAPVTKQKPKN